MERTRLNVYNDFPASLIDYTIAEWVHSERNRRILRYKIIDDLSFERIAEIEDMSSKRIQTIVYSAEDVLVPRLKTYANPA